MCFEGALEAYVPGAILMTVPALTASSAALMLENSAPAVSSTRTACGSIRPEMTAPTECHAKYHGCFDAYARGALEGVCALAAQVGFGGPVSSIFF